MRHIPFFPLVIVLILVHSGLVCSTVQAHHTPDRFETLTTDQGLSQNSAICALQDQHGFLWFGTQNGLNRYDGYSFETFFNEPNNPESLSESYVISLYEDRSGNVWVGTLGGGLNRFNREKKSFVRYTSDLENADSLIDNTVNNILEDQKGYLWVGTQRGLDRLDPSTGRFQHFLRMNNSSKAYLKNGVQALFEDSSGILWVGTDNGLFQWDPKDQQFVQLTRNGESNNEVAVKALFEDSKGRFWIGSSNTISQYDPIARKVTSKFPDTGEVRSITERTDGTIWFASSQKGLISFENKGKKFKAHLQSPGSASSQKSNSISFVLADRLGGIWIGMTEFSGINHLIPENKDFTLYRPDPEQKNWINAEKIYGFIEDEKGNVYIATYGYGLNYWDRSEGSFKTYLLGNGDFSDNIIISLAKTLNGEIWVGTAKGLYLFNTRNGEFSPFPLSMGKQEDFTKTIILSLFSEPDGTVWVGTKKKGLFKINRHTNEIRQFRSEMQDETSLSFNSVSKVIRDRSGSLWIGTLGGGVNRFDEMRNRFSVFQHDASNSESLSSNFVLTLFEDSSKTLWVATNKGLNRFQRSSQTFSFLTTEDGLPNNAITGVMEDSRGFLWLSTDNGISRFEPGTGKFMNYGLSDGLQGTEFLFGSYYKTLRGEMLFGGVNGFNLFVPEKVGENVTHSTLTLTRFRKGGELVLSPETLETVVLDWRNNYFEFEAAVLNYQNQSKNHYSFQLEGIDKDWYYAGVHRQGHYSNLPPGNYTLIIRASQGGNGRWNKNLKTISILVEPPPWQTWWAYLFYGICFLVGVAIILVAFRRKLQRERLLVGELQQIDQMKNEFLANTSHELLTPLNGIIGIAESMLDDPKSRSADELAHNLSLISRSGKRLALLVQDILDFSKLKDNHLHINRKPVELRGLIDEVVLICQPVLSNKPVRIILDISTRTVFAEADENRFQQILICLLSNAIKFTDRGEVKISVKQLDQQIQVSVSDTGVGIPADRLKTIFQPFEQLSEQSEKPEGTGLGLGIAKILVELHGGTLEVESTPGKGSCFFFSLASSKATPVTSASDFQEREMIIAPLGFNTLLKSRNSEERSNKKNQLLIVEDDVVNLQVLLNQLGAHFNITTALNGDEALRLIEKDPFPDLILLDVMMPGIDGYELCKEIRMMHSTVELPILLLTAKTQVDDLVKGLRAGANDYVTKPFQKAELLARIENQMKLSEAFQQLKENERLLNELENRERSEQHFVVLQKHMIQILNYTEEPVLLVEEGGTIRFANNPASKLLGFLNVELENQNIEMIFPKFNTEIDLDSEFSNGGLLSEAPQLKPYQLSIQQEVDPLQKMTVFLSVFNTVENMIYLLKLGDHQKKGDDPVDQGYVLDPVTVASNLDNTAPPRQFKDTLQQEQREETSLIAETAALSNESVLRQQMVKVLNISLDYWETIVGKSKVELAEASKIWKASYDGKAGYYTRTLNKYLTITTLPKNPRWRDVIRTANFVLRQVPQNRKRKHELKQELILLEKMLLNRK